jgi:hypothetical protein
VISPEGRPSTSSDVSDRVTLPETRFQSQAIIRPARRAEARRSLVSHRTVWAARCSWMSVRLPIHSRTDPSGFLSGAARATNQR